MPQNIFEKIKEEHEEFKGMIGSLATKTSKQEDTFEQFKTEIKAHNEAEEQTMYRELKKEKKSKEMALVGIEEHHIATEVLNKMIKSKTKEGEEFRVQANVLKNLLEKHIEVEEGKVIPMAQELLPKNIVDDLREQFESIEEKLEE